MGDLEIYDEYISDTNVNKFFEDMYKTIKYNRELQRVHTSSNLERSVSNERFRK